MSATVPGPLRTPWWKRALDLLIGIPASVVGIPVAVGIGILIVLESGWPPLYSDGRVGIGGRRFRMIKFRTMVAGARASGLGIQVAQDDPRVTRVGRILRRYSLDELPQLWNVLRGEMSLVGPRPAPPEQVARYSARHLGRLRTRPGISGLAQVSGRNDLSWDERIEHDLAYIERMSAALDLRILLATVGVALRGSGLYGRSGVTPDYGERLPARDAERDGAADSTARRSDSET